LQNPMRSLRASARFRVGRRTTIVLAVLGAALLAEAGSVLAGATPGVFSLTGKSAVQVPRAPLAVSGTRVIVGHSYRHDASHALRRMRAARVSRHGEVEASPNPRPLASHDDAPDTVVQHRLAKPRMPASLLNFDGIAFPGVACECAPPDTNGEVGSSQYVQVVNQGLQVFDKTTGASVYGPVDIATVWSGFGGTCESDTWGDPIVLYDQLADRWVVSQFAGYGTYGAMTDECIAVSQTGDATGAYYRYAFQLGPNFYDYPHLGVWPDGYYMSDNVFDAAGSSYLGPQPFAFDRAAMLTGAPATFLTSTDPAIFNSSNDPILPADLDGSIQPPAGAPNPFIELGTNSTWPIWRFHADFANPSSSTFTRAATLTPAAYTVLCPSTRSCVPQAESLDGLDGLGDRPMFRSAYRRFEDGHEALVGNLTVASGGVAGIRWWEVDNVTSGTPSFVQQATYQPDSTWRWMGSAAMDGAGDLALGFSASSASINPQVRYAGRLPSDPAGTLGQGEATLFSGTGSQTGTRNRWGDYSDMTVDPSDQCTFWYTQEYYASTSFYNWKTRIGNFRFPSCARRCKVPKVVGRTLKTAKSRITNSYCRVGQIKKKKSSKRKRGKVLAQSPKPGKTLYAYAKITLTVGK
jgi:PASTA domain